MQLSWHLHYLCLFNKGLPQNDRAKHSNTHFICCSNKVAALDLAEPIVDNLQSLETGIPMYDAYLKQTILVLAPVLLIIADNPMAAELCNHLGNSARKFCRMCLVCEGAPAIGACMVKKYR